MAEREADVVAKDRAEEAEQRDEHDVEAPGARVHGAEDQDGLARNRHPEVLDQHQSDHGQIAVVIQGGLEREVRPADARPSLRRSPPEESRPVSGPGCCLARHTAPLIRLGGKSSCSHACTCPRSTGRPGGSTPSRSAPPSCAARSSSWTSGR